MVQPKPLCPFCSKANCYHCWECGALLMTEDHEILCPHNPSDLSPLLTLLPEIICPACEDTGKNSRGGICIPCAMAGRIK